MRYDSLSNQVTNLDNVILVCLGRPAEDELPQIGDEDSVIVDLLQDLTCRSYESVALELHHQFDPSYYKGD